MLIDSHAHLDDPRFNEDRDSVLQRAWDTGIREILTIGNGNGPDQMGGGVPIAENHDWIYTTAGIHPHDASKAEERHYGLMEQLTRHPRVLAIGETGLDYYYDNSPRDVQREVFRLRCNGPARGVIHCFTSGEKLANFALEIGFYISFSGIVTFPKAQGLIDVARRIPRDRILVETDCPYLAPVPHRGKRNEPSFVGDTARFIAGLRGMPLEEFSMQTSANFHRLFAVKSS
jgi:TatD DNase family protein